MSRASPTPRSRRTRRKPARAYRPVGQQRVAYSAQLARPAQMRLDVVDTDRDDTGMLGGKRLARAMEADDLGGTDKREIVRIEEQHDHLGIDLRKPQASGAVAGRTGQIEWRRSVSRLQHLRT